jgi:hypothetical protein
MMRRFAFAVAGLLVFGGCASPSHPGDPGNVTPGVQVQTGREFDIAVGQTVEVQGTPMTIRFSGVAEDSRCPVDVQCVWAGNAIVRLTISTSGGTATDASLNTTLDPKSTTASGYTIRLAALKPVPRSGTTIPASAYVATLEVRAN